MPFTTKRTLRIPSSLRRRTEGALSRLNIFVSFLVIIISVIVVAYVVLQFERYPTLPDKLGTILLDQENKWRLVDAIDHFRSERTIPLEKGVSLPFRTIWIRVDLTELRPSNGEVLTLKAIRAKQALFWSVRTEHGRSITEPLEWKPTSSGISVILPKARDTGFEIIAKIEPIAINRIQLSISSNSDVITQNLKFERTGGLLAGALLMIAFFSLVVAIFNRDLVFFLFAAWLLSTLRIAGYNGGWDAYWLSIPISGDSLQLFLRLTYIAHSLISLALFQALFIKELRANHLQNLISILQILTVAICVPALLLDATGSLNSLWVLSAITIGAVLYILVRLAIKAPSQELLWYIGSWTVTLLGSIAQIAFNFGFNESILNIANSQTTAGVSALMLGVTLAQKMNTERQARIIAQNSAITALQRFRQNYNATPVGIFLMKFDGTLLEHNPTFSSMFVLEGQRASKVGMNWATLLGKDALDRISEQADGSRMMDSEIAVRSGIGDKRWFHVRAVRKHDCYEGWIEDISARKEAEAQLKFLVNHDPLTGILNRRGVEPALERATGLARERVISLAYVDLDRFKLVNDLFGHATGDQILRQMASRLRTVVAPPHIAARVGGDEFILIIESLSLEEARSLCERLRAVLSNQPYQYQDKAFTVSASIGVVRILPGMTPADALTASDRACSEAKRKGGRSVVCFDSDSAELSDYLEEIRIVAQIKERLPIENFFLVYQPIISLRHPDAGLSYEALIRMRDANGVVQSPARFIPAAERNGLMTQIDRWVLRDMLEWLDENPSHQDKLDFCTLNLSGASLNDEKFLQDTIALIRNHRLASRKICFEITESVALYDLNTTRRFVDSVKFLGAKVALDDFGAGYTSFSYLKELPADFVKIDGNFILNINSNAANYAIAHAIVELTRKLGMACIAEWAENDDIIRSLIELDVDYAQGFGLCGPLEREKIMTSRNGITLINNRTTTRLVLNAAIAQSRKGRRKTLPH